VPVVWHEGPFDARCGPGGRRHGAAGGPGKGLRLAVAVVDSGGIARVLLADDGAGPIAIETARRKAYTAAVNGFSTTVFATFAANPVGGGDADTAERITTIAVKKIAELLA
jgi:uncharacterized protein GlcG (DUF336 family)